MKKIVLFAFNGELMCFGHVLLNALDMSTKGYEVRIVFEGAATKLIPLLAQKDTPFHALYIQTKEKGLVDGVCKACATKMGVLDDVKRQGLTLLSELSGHPSMARYRDDGFEIITF